MITNLGSPGREPSAADLAEGVDQVSMITMHAVWAGEYDDARPLAVFEDRAQAVRWGRRWERAHRGQHGSATSVHEIVFVPAGGRPPRVSAVS